MLAFMIFAETQRHIFDTVKTAADYESYHHRAVNVLTLTFGPDL